MAINYLDRQVLSVLAPEIRDAFHLSNTDYARIVLAFQLSYMLSSGLGGRLVDLVGVRLGYAAMVLFWSASAVLHGLASGTRSLMACRFLLGLGEGGAFPAAVKAMAEWFSGKERGVAVGFINSSLALGGILAPPLTVYVALQFGWRAAFVILGALGFLWLGSWLPLYASPPPPPQPEPAAEAAVRPRDLLRLPAIWGLLGARLIADPPWQFYMFWLPEYLKRVRGMGLAEIGMVAWMPFLLGPCFSQFDSSWE
jgi:ACS family hexuronate transporter-like MFS transporter